LKEGGGDRQEKSPFRGKKKNKKKKKRNTIGNRGKKKKKRQAEHVPPPGRGKNPSGRARRRGRKKKRKHLRGEGSVLHRIGKGKKGKGNAPDRPLVHQERRGGKQTSARSGVEYLVLPLGKKKKGSEKIAEGKKTSPVDRLLKRRRGKKRVEQKGVRGKRERK